jgi:hypothetical protein
LTPPLKKWGFFKMKTNETDLALSIGQTLEAMRQIMITDDTGYHLAGEFLKRVKATAKDVEAHFQPEYEVVYSAYKEVLDHRKSYQNLLAEAEATVKVKMGEYNRLIERRAAAERQKIAEQQAADRAAAEASGAVLFDVAPPAPIVEAPKVAGVYEVITYRYEITDLEKLPRYLMIPDDKKIGQLVRVGGKSANIPGVTVIEEKGMRARA